GRSNVDGARLAARPRPATLRWTVYYTSTGPRNVRRCTTSPFVTAAGDSHESRAGRVLRVGQEHGIPVAHGRGPGPGQGPTGPGRDGRRAGRAARQDVPAL